MSILFSDILPKISKYQIVQSVNMQLETPYQWVRLLSKNEEDIVPETIYIGKSSLVPPEIHQQNNIGLILINDGNLDFSLLNGNAVEIAPETDLFELFNDVLDALNSQRRIIDSSAILLNCLIQGEGLDGIIQKGAEILGNFISLVDYTGKQLATSDNQEIDSVGWFGLAPDGYPKQETYSIFRTSNYTKQVNESPIPILLDFDNPEVPRLIVGKIAINNKTVGHLAVLENNKPFEDDAIEIVKVLIDVIASEVKKNNYYLMMVGIQHEYFILDLLQEKHNNPTTIDDRVKSLQWDAYKDFFVVTISIPRTNDAFFFVEYLRTRLTHIFPFSKSVFYEENVILVIYKEREIQKIKRELTSIVVENSLTAGISLRFSSIKDLKRHYEQTKQALSLGKLLKKDEHIFLYEDLYMYDLLTILNKNANLKDFCHPGIEKIIRYDNENGTDYYNTLFEYLMGSGNLAQVAKKLFIHRNTLYHRINKISEITELNLEDGDDYLKMLLSFKIMELYDISSDLEN